MASMARTAQVGLVSIIGLIGVGSCGGDDSGNGVASGALEVRRFDVVEVGFPAIVFRGNPPPEDSVPLPPEGQLPRVRGRWLGDAITDLIRERTGGDAAWGSGGAETSTSMEIRNGILIVRNSPSVLKRVEDLIDEMRASGDPLTHYFPSFQ